ncbi:hypothetical protein DRE_03166 [Drechslerella stenobrocha 248]|uniref:Uncharacterized protein n=1 Tax=Drechslerella stenobrocha 248 TaxID=1043628 RepID=W7HTS9_9PEZI|nr:hypothetical protein DRE_03166 [Drechslerella stenobrocha 248]
MNRLPNAIGRLPRSRLQFPPAGAEYQPAILHRPLSTTQRLLNPAGEKQRPNLPGDKERTSESPKSSDEKITDRALEAEKGKAPFTEKEQERKGLDRKEGIGEGEGEK